MRRKQEVIKFGEFMSGSYKEKPVKKRKSYGKTVKKVATSTAIPLIFAPKVFAEGTAQMVATPEAIPVFSGSQFIGEKSLEVLAHALDPVIELMVALSFPIASVIIVGACFFFMFGNNEKAWTTIQNAGLGYILIQLAPMLLNILKEVGKVV
ncbi:hypothetical protein BpsS36_00055 [Bacillus phage vB_BpsS-36]|uniref:Uncharacterized protein n=1 Tax=Bacillus phage vB_BpsS-36 TaxID=2419622 RepID=A0A3G3BXU8_9CAUD|nr:hypothetical protein BpsS36_00055 [Bacillus phage vB_BpsS-36]